MPRVPGHGTPDGDRKLLAGATKDIQNVSATLAQLREIRRPGTCAQETAPLITPIDGMPPALANAARVLTDKKCHIATEVTQIASKSRLIYVTLRGSRLIKRP